MSLSPRCLSPLNTPLPSPPLSPLKQPPLTPLPSSLPRPPRPLLFTRYPCHAVLCQPARATTHTGGARRPPLPLQHPNAFLILLQGISAMKSNCLTYDTKGEVWCKRGGVVSKLKCGAKGEIQRCSATWHWDSRKCDWLAWQQQGDCIASNFV